MKKLDRFRRTRNDANYRGYTVSVEQAREIAEFWKTCADELIEPNFRTLIEGNYK